MTCRAARSIPVHSIDLSTYDEATNTYVCDGCGLSVDAKAWACPCPGESTRLAARGTA